MSRDGLPPARESASMLPIVFLQVVTDNTPQLSELFDVYLQVDSVQELQSPRHRATSMALLVLLNGLLIIRGPGPGRQRTRAQRRRPG